MKQYKYKRIVSIIIAMVIILSSTNVSALFGTIFNQKEVGKPGSSSGTPGESTGTLGESEANPGHTLDEIIQEGMNFIQAGQKEPSKIDGENLKIGSETLYNILLVLGIFLTVAVGMFLGAKFMVSSVEDKAKVKEALIPYIAGCVVIYGAFVIWKLAILLLGGMS